MTCTAKDCIKPVEEAYAIRYKDYNLNNRALRADNSPQYIAKEFKNTLKLLNIKHEYIKKQPPEDNGALESFHTSLKTDYIWLNELENFEDANKLMEYAFNDYNNYSTFFYRLFNCKFEKQWNSSEEFKNKFIEERRKKED